MKILLHKNLELIGKLKFKMSAKKISGQNYTKMEGKFEKLIRKFTNWWQHNYKQMWVMYKSISYFCGIHCFKQQTNGPPSWYKEEKKIIVMRW